MKLSHVSNIEIDNIYSKIQFSNSVGTIFDDGILLHMHNIKYPIYFDNIKRIEIKKRKWILINIICLFFTTLLIYFLFKCQLTKLEMILIAFLSIISLVLSFMINTSSYLMIVVMVNFNFLELKLKPSFKNDAKRIAGKVNRIIKKKNMRL